MSNEEGTDLRPVYMKEEKDVMKTKNREKDKGQRTKKRRTKEAKNKNTLYSTEKRRVGSIVCRGYNGA